MAAGRSSAEKPEDGRLWAGRDALRDAAVIARRNAVEDRMADSSFET
jgi:hypothetical protein